MSRAITTEVSLDVLPVGSVVTLTTADGVVVNAAVKSDFDEWGLAGQVSRFTTAKLFSLAVKRDGFTLAHLS